MEPTLEWDPQKESSNLKKHGVSFIEAVTALEDELALTVEDDHPHERRFITIGGVKPGGFWWLFTPIGVRQYGSSRRAKPQHGNKRRMRSKPMEEDDMKAEYDFSKGKRGAILPMPGGKERITIRLDKDILDWFRQQVISEGGGNYQTNINLVLREFMLSHQAPLEELLRRVLREELAEYKTK